MIKKIKLLFVCTSGYRAGVASSVFSENDKYETNSCGVYSVSKEELEKLVIWSDKVIAITKEHYIYLKNMGVDAKKLVNLDISNQDSHNEEKLISLCKETIFDLIDKPL